MKILSNLFDYQDLANQDITTGLTSGLNLASVLLDGLISAYCDELLANYAYLSSSYNVRGKGRERASEELKQHSEEEYKHAIMLAERIKQLGGTLPSTYGMLISLATAVPVTGTTIFEVRTLMAEGAQDERQAINIYTELISKAEELKDYATVDILSSIIVDEQTHLQDFLNAMEEGETIIPSILFTNNL